MSSNNNRTGRTIPEPVRRLVRKKCGFGCVICGCPIYNYDHIEEFSVVKEHDPENIALLCPTCHMKKGKLITKDMIRKAMVSESAPRTSPDYIPPQNYSLDIGGNIVENFVGGCVFQIWDFGHVDIVFDDVPLISAVINDSAGQNALVIEKNLYTFSSQVWDIEYVGKTITFRNGPRDVFCSITIDPEVPRITFRANLVLSNGVRIQINDDGIYANKKLLAARNLIVNTGAAITIAGAPIKRPYAFRGHVFRNTISGIAGISGLNTASCEGNIMHRCELAFVWTLDYLAEYAGA